MCHTHALWMVGTVLEIVGRLNSGLQATLLRAFESFCPSSTLWWLLAASFFLLLFLSFQRSSEVSAKTSVRTRRRMNSGPRDPGGIPWPVVAQLFRYACGSLYLSVQPDTLGRSAQDATLGSNIQEGAAAAVELGRCKDARSQHLHLSRPKN